MSSESRNLPRSPAWKYSGKPLTAFEDDGARSVFMS